MIKFNVLHKTTGEIKFTAEIDCDEDAPHSIKLGLAVKWGIKHYADLRYANLSYADLSYANLSSANLSYASLHSANLRYTNLRYANLSYADLRYANLSYANLRYAKNSIVPVCIGQVGEEIRTGYAIWDVKQKDVMVRLGCRYDTEKVVIKAVSDKYGSRSGYAMMVRAACKIARERKVLNPTG